MCTLIAQVGLCLCRFVSAYVAPNPEAHVDSLHKEVQLLVFIMLPREQPVHSGGMRRKQTAAHITLLYPNE